MHFSTDLLAVKMVGYEVTNSVFMQVSSASVTTQLSIEYYIH